jgi:ABC-2 type transport system permease protein
MIALIVMGLLSFALTNVGLTIAWRIDSTQAFPAITNLILIPLWLLSGAFFPAEGLPAAFKWTMRLDPLTYPMAALREALYGGGSTRLPNAGFSIGITALLCVLTFLLATRSARRGAAW